MIFQFALLVKILISSMSYLKLMSFIWDLKNISLFYFWEHFLLYSTFLLSGVWNQFKAQNWKWHKYSPFSTSSLCSSLDVTDTLSFLHLKNWNNNRRMSTRDELLRGKPMLIACFLFIQFAPSRNSLKVCHSWVSKNVVQWGDQ